MIVHETLTSVIERTARLVVTPIADQETLVTAASTDLSRSSDIIELRIDALTECLDETQEFAESCACPILLTVRDQREGGATPLSAPQRSQLYHRFLGTASALDIEVQCLSQMASVVEAAKNHGKLIVASAHDFDQMIPPSTIGSLVKDAAGAADIFKIAATPADLSEVFLLAALASDSNIPFPVSAMGMGKFGRISRLVCAQAGSVLNYGYLSKPNAPGQWPSEQLKSLIAQLVE